MGHQGIQNSQHQSLLVQPDELIMTTFIPSYNYNVNTGINGKIIAKLPVNLQRSPITPTALLTNKAVGYWVGLPTKPTSTHFWLA